MTALDLVVIHPGAAHGIYGSDLAQSLVAVEPPLFCRIIAAYVRDRGFTVKIIDAEAEQLGPHEVGEIIRDLKPRLACLAVYGHQPSASTQQMDGAGKTARAIKNQCHVPVIMVGGHVSALPARTLNEEAIDYACVGEGPITIHQLLGGQVDKIVPGLVWRDGDKIKINLSAPLLHPADLHGDAWDLLPMHRYRAHQWHCFGDLSKRQPYASVATSFGCPYKCAFCCINAPFETNRYRMRSPAAVVEEIDRLNRIYSVTSIKFTDEMFVLNQQHYTDICNLLISRGLGDKLNIWAYSRIDTIKPDTLAMMRKAGIRWLALGIESGSKHVRDGSQKALRNEDIVGVVRQVQAAGINVIGNYIFGLPDDNFASMGETLKLAMILNTEFANFYSAMAYPGSPLYDQAVREGEELPSSWRGYSQHNADCHPLGSKHLYPSDVVRFRDNAFQTYFVNPAYQDMVREKFGTEAADHVRAMTTFTLKRKLLEEKEAEHA